MPLKNVALFGPMYSGKSTIAQALVDSGYQKMSFAGPLKNVAALAYGTIGKSSEYDVIRNIASPEALPDFQTVVVSGRQILQDVGQFVKWVDRDFWMKCFFRDAKRYLDTPLTVDDGRFLFEFQALQDEGWLTVGIDTPHDVRMQRAVTINGREPTESEQNHESELEVPSIIAKADLVVSGVTDPYLNVKSILERARA